MAIPAVTVMQFLPQNDELDTFHYIVELINLMVFCSLGTVPATGRGRLCAFWKCLGIKFGSRAHGWGAVSRTDQLCKSDSIFILHKYAS